MGLFSLHMWLEAIASRYIYDLDIKSVHFRTSQGTRTAQDMILYIDIDGTPPEPRFSYTVFAVFSNVFGTIRCLEFVGFVGLGGVHIYIYKNLYAYTQCSRNHESKLSST